MPEKADPFSEHRCRPGCGACCIAPSISSAIPGLPQGKASGIICPHLTPDMLCAIFDSPDRPAVCANFSFDPLICGNDREEALNIMYQIEKGSRESQV